MRGTMGRKLLHFVSILSLSPVRCLTTFQFAEMSNLHTHLTLRSLRPEGTRKRAIPHGYGFDLVSCPNYFFEIMGWAVIAIMTGSIAGAPSFFFQVFDLVLIWIWILYSYHFYWCFCCDDVNMGSQETKELPKGIWKEFPRGRKAIIPFILWEIPNLVLSFFTTLLFENNDDNCNLPMELLRSVRTWKKSSRWVRHFD